MRRSFAIVLAGVLALWGLLGDGISDGGRTGLSGGVDGSRTNRPLAPPRRDPPRRPAERSSQHHAASHSPVTAEPIAAEAQPESPQIGVPGRGWADRTTVPDELLVALSGTPDAATLAEALAPLGMSVVRVSSMVPAARVRVAPGTDLAEASRQLSSLPMVLHANPHAVTHAAGVTTGVCPPDGAWMLKKGSGVGARMRIRPATCDGTCQECSPNGNPVELPVGELQWPLGCLELAELAPKGATGRGVVVAVLDTGVAYEQHVDPNGLAYAQAPDLSHVPFVDPWDFIGGDAHANDDNGHGTLMTTLLAGFGGAFSVAPNVTVMPVKVLDRDNAGTELELVEGIDWAVDHGANIISLSLTLPLDYAPSVLLQQALGRALHAGVVVVAAAGNDGASQVAWPAAFPGVVAVGASEYPSVSNCKEPVIAGYSNRSPRVDIALPAGTHGVDSDEDGYPDAALGMSFPPGEPELFGYWFISGTSPAAAMAAGIAALLLEGGLDPTFVVAGLQESTVGGTSKLAGANGADKRVAGMVVDAGKLRSRIGNSKPPCGAGHQVHVNPVGVLERSSQTDSDKSTRGRFAVEVLDSELMPAKDAVVFASIEGDREEWLTAKADADGIAHFLTSSVPESAAVDGVRLSLRVEGVSVKGCDGLLVRPSIFTRIEESTYVLLSSLHVGGSARAILLYVDPTAVASIEGATPTASVPTYLHRVLGTGMATTSLVTLMDDTYLNVTGQRSVSAIFRTFGVGMATTSIVVDKAFFAPERLSPSPSQLLVLARTVGVGMATTSIVRDGQWIAADAPGQALGADPALLRLAVGPGQESSVVVQDRSLLDVSLQGAGGATSGLPDASVTGVGMATTSLVQSLDASTLTSIWTAWKSTAGSATKGVGMATTSLLALQGPSLLVGLWPAPNATLGPSMGAGATSTRLEDY